MIRELITAKEGGFERLNKVVTRFRDDMESTFEEQAMQVFNKGTMLALGFLRRTGADFNGGVTLQSSPFPSDGSASEVAGAVEELLMRGEFTYSELLLQNIVGWVDLAIKGHPSVAENSPIGWSVVSSDGKTISDSKPQLVKIQYSEQVWADDAEVWNDIPSKRMAGINGYQFGMRPAFRRNGSTISFRSTTSS